jgi:Secretion system C-terminal sorting domain
LTGTSIAWGYAAYDLSLSEEVAGCTDVMACNYDELATCDNGTCDYYCSGCMDPLALNYNASVLFDDGSCIYQIDLPNMGMNVVPDEDNDQFYVLLNMMNEGNGAPYVLSNDYDADLIMITESGQYVMGPYPCDETVGLQLQSMATGMSNYFEGELVGECVSTVAVLDVNQSQELSVYPNPIGTNFTLTGLQDGMVTVELLDISGRTIWQEARQVSGNRLELTNQWSSGLYMIKCNQGSATYFSKIIIP